MKKRFCFKPAVFILAILALFAMAGFFGCATTGTNTQNLDPLTQAKKTATYFLHIWNSQFDNAMLMAKMPNLTEDQKQIVRTKKKLLTQSKSLIDTFASAVDAGKIPTAESEVQINNLIDQLVGMAGGV